MQKAARFFRESLQLFLKTENLYGINFTLEGFASLAVAEQRWGTAGLLFSYSESQFQGPRPPVELAAVDRDLAVLRANVSEQELAGLSAEGSKMTMEGAIALALVLEE